MSFYEILEDRKIIFKRNFETKTLSKIKAGGYADYVIFPSFTEQLIEVVELCKKFGIKFKIIGACSNTFFDNYNGALILTKKLRDISFDTDLMEIRAACGASLSMMIYQASIKGISIYPELIGIPASIGGAVVNNAGAFGNQIDNSIIGCMVYDPKDMKSHFLSKETLRFSYRNTALQKSDLILLWASFKYEIRSKNIIQSYFGEIIQKRKNLHPKEPSLGSFFKRSSNIIPAKLIDEAGLKGFRIGDAAVSEKHAGFIVNKGSALASDINSVADYVEDRIFSKYNIKLEREAEFVS